MGDFSQRIQDHERIESFLTSQSLITLFSAITFTVFFGVLWYYDFTILLVYVALTAISVLWSLFWMKKERCSIISGFSSGVKIRNLSMRSLMGYQR